MKDVTDKVQIIWRDQGVNATTTAAIPNRGYVQEDRNFYRQLTNRLLIEEADRKPTAELAVVLAERLLAEMRERNALVVDYELERWRR